MWKLRKLKVLISIFLFFFFQSELVFSENLLFKKEIKIDCYQSPTIVPGPKSIAFHPNEKEVWITSLMNKKKGVVILNLQTGKEKSYIVLPNGGGVEVIFNKDGSKAYVSQMETARVFEIDTQTKKINRIFKTKSSWTKVLALDNEEKFLYASNWSGNDVSIIDLKTGELVKRIPTVKTPRGIYVTKDNKFLYVAGFKDGEIEKIDLKTGRGIILYKTGGAMRHIASDEERGYLYFSDMAKAAIFKVNMKNDKVEFFAKTDINPNTIVLTPDKKILIVSNRGPNHPSGKINIRGPRKGTIYLFDTETKKLLYKLIGSYQPTGLAVSPDGKYFVYSNFLDGTIKICKILR